MGSKRYLYEELCLEHPHTVRSNDDPTKRVRGTEFPLIQLLDEAVGSSYGVGSGGGSSRANAPVDLTALLLRDEIEKAVTTYESRVVGTCLPEDVALVKRVSQWLCSMDDRMYFNWVPQLRLWSERIRDVLEPVKRVPLRDVQCAACGEALVSLLAPNAHGPNDRVVAPALLVHLEPDSPWAECRVCRTEYPKEALKALGADGLYIPPPAR